MYWEDLFEKAWSLYWGAVISEGLEVKVYISSSLLWKLTLDLGPDVIRVLSFCPFDQRTLMY